MIEQADLVEMGCRDQAAGLGQIIGAQIAFPHDGELPRKGRHCIDRRDLTEMGVDQQHAHAARRPAKAGSTACWLLPSSPVRLTTRIGTP